MMRPNASVEKVYLYPKPVDFRKSIDGLYPLHERHIPSRYLTADAVLPISIRSSSP